MIPCVQGVRSQCAAKSESHRIAHRLHRRFGLTMRLKVSRSYQNLNNFASAHLERIDPFLKYIDENSQSQKNCTGA